MTTIDRNRYDLFALAGQLLARYQERNHSFYPRAVELALALQVNHLPPVGSSQGLELDHVVDLCDQIFTKHHPYLGEGWVWPPFNHDPHGLPRPLGHRDPGWYKACNGQQGIGCHAQSLNFWQNPVFLEEDRDLCPFRLYDGVTSLTLDQGRQKCGFDGNPCGWRPGLPKFLQVLGRNHHAQVFQAPSSLIMWQELIPEPLPLYPLMQSLYFAHEQLGTGERWITPEHFQQDFNFSPELFQALFNQDPDQLENQEFLRQVLAPEQPLLIRFTPPKNSAMRPRPTGGYLVLDPEEAPRYQKSGLPSGLFQDPLIAERRRRRQLARTKTHDRVLKQFRRWFRLAGKEVREDPDTFDFLAVDDSLILLGEVKILGQQDSLEVIQEIVGQLLYYEYFALVPWRQAGFPLAKCGIFDHPPLGEYIDFLHKLDILCFWMDEEGFIDGSAPSLNLLDQLGVQTRPDPELDS